MDLLYQFFYPLQLLAEPSVTTLLSWAISLLTSGFDHAAFEPTPFPYIQSTTR